MDVQAMLPTAAPVRFVAADGTPAEPPTGYAEPSSQRLLRAYRRMLLGRRFDQQAAALVRQGRVGGYRTGKRRGREEGKSLGVPDPLKKKKKTHHQTPKNSGRETMGA